MTVNEQQVLTELLTIEKETNRRWNKGDVDGALSAYSEDVTYFDPITATRLDGRKAVEAYFREVFEGKLDILRNEFPNPQVIVSDAGDLAVLNYNFLNFVADGKGGEKPGASWNYTQVSRRIDGQWRTLHVNWSLTRLPAAMQSLMS